MRLRAVIIDDELPTLNLMKYMIKKDGRIDIIGDFSSSKEALSQINILKPDVAFIDVEMPGINGILLAQELEKLEYKIQVIFATAYKEYAFDAFKVEASDYILKPVTEEQVKITIDKILKRYPLIFSKNRMRDIDEISSKEISKVHDSEGINTLNLNKSYKKENTKIENAKNKSKKNQNESLSEEYTRSNKNQRCKISCLGQFTVYMENEDTGSLNQIKFETVKVEELFAYLTLSEGRPVEKWRLCEILWTDFPDKKAEHNLHSAIYRLKSSFKKSGFTEDLINYKNGCYTLNVDNFYCDLWDFRKLENYKKLEDSNIIIVEKILDLYQGELYGNKAYIWSIDEGQKLNDLNVHMTMKLSNYYIESKQHDIAIKYLYKLLRLNNYNEEVYELMMKCYFYKGDKVKLMKFYKDLKDTLAKELDVKPSKTTVELYNYLIKSLE